MKCQLLSLTWKFSCFSSAFTPLINRKPLKFSRYALIMSLLLFECKKKEEVWYFCFTITIHKQITDENNALCLIMHGALKSMLNTRKFNLPHLNFLFFTQLPPFYAEDVKRKLKFQWRKLSSFKSIKTPNFLWILPSSDFPRKFYAR